MKIVIKSMLVALLIVGLASMAYGQGKVVVYSGRGESLVGPLLKMFTEDTGIKVEVRYGDSAEMAATILEEGRNSPADVFFSQDAGALGALAKRGRLVRLSNSLLESVGARFRSPEGVWVGVSGRARVVVYNTEKLKESDLPPSILGFTDPKWRGRIGWAPTNGSFQAFVTAFRLKAGNKAAREWLMGVIANRPRVYPNNTSIVRAVAAGEIDVGFVNHYYLYQFLADQGKAFKARNNYNLGGDVGALVNVAGVGIIDTAKNRAEADAFVGYLLSEKAQAYFTEKTYEYPLIPGIKTNELLKPLAEIDTPNIDLSNLDDLAGTLELLQDVGALN
jgi:iron(III) transport system substrate-binding protein